MRHPELVSGSNYVSGSDYLKRAGEWKS